MTRVPLAITLGVTLAIVSDEVTPELAAPDVVTVLLVVELSSGDTPKVHAERVTRRTEPIRKIRINKEITITTPPFYEIFYFFNPMRASSIEKIRHNSPSWSQYPLL